MTKPCQRCGTPISISGAAHCNDCAKKMVEEAAKAASDEHTKTHLKKQFQQNPGEFIAKYGLCPVCKQPQTNGKCTNPACSQSKVN